MSNGSMGKLYMSKKEIWSFGFAGIGQNMIYGMRNAYLMISYKDSMGIIASITGTMLIAQKNI